MSDLSIPEPVGYHPQALDIQHDTDPAHEEYARRIPHLGHAALFFGIVIVSIGVCIVAALVVAMLVHPHQTPSTANMIHTAAIAQLAAYFLTFAIAFPVFPLLWQRSFLDGIHWTFRAARLNWWKLMLIGLALSLFAQIGEHFVKTPKDIDMLKLLDSPLAAYLTAISGAIIAPIVEEIAFRGFLLPSLATAYDWLCLDRTPAARFRWQQTTHHTSAALVLSSVVTSVIFAGLHGFQIHFSIGILGILFTVSLVLSAVRVRFHSVAASALVHITYNSVLFLEIFAKTGGFRHLERLAQ